MWEVTSLVVPMRAVASLGHFLSKGLAACEWLGQLSKAKDRRGSPATLERTMGVAEGERHDVSNTVQFQKGQKGEADGNIFGFPKVY